jgi:hypothetical protein
MKTANVLFLIACGLIFATSALIQATSAQGALLEGKLMDVDLFHRTTVDSPETGVGSGDFLVGPGVELEDFGSRSSPPILPPLVDIDVSDRQILVTLVQNQPLAFQEELRFVDPNNNISGFANVFVNPATNWAGFTPSRVLFGSEFILLNLSQLSGLQGQQILLDIVPEPTASILLVTGAASCGLFVRGRGVGR